MAESRQHFYKINCVRVLTYLPVNEDLLKTVFPPTKCVKQSQPIFFHNEALSNDESKDTSGDEQYLSFFDPDYVKSSYVGREENSEPNCLC